MRKTYRYIFLLYRQPNYLRTDHGETGTPPALCPRLCLLPASRSWELEMFSERMPSSARDGKACSLSCSLKVDLKPLAGRWRCHANGQTSTVERALCPVSPGSYGHRVRVLVEVGFMNKHPKWHCRWSRYLHIYQKGAWPFPSEAGRTGGPPSQEGCPWFFYGFNPDSQGRMSHFCVFPTR